MLEHRSLGLNYTLLFRLNHPTVSHFSLYQSGSYLQSRGRDQQKKCPTTKKIVVFPLSDKTKIFNITGVFVGYKFMQSKRFDQSHMNEMICFAKLPLISAVVVQSDTITEYRCFLGKIPLKKYIFVIRRSLSQGTE